MAQDRTSHELYQQAQARLGSTLKGKWRLDALIGVGGMAAVYAATHRNGLRVAVKLLHPALSLTSSVHERFRREGLDVVTRVAVPVTDAMTGATVTVPTVDGEAHVELRAGTQPNDEYVLRGKGFPALNGRGRGDQRVVVEVRIPKVHTDEARKAVEKLADQLDARAYKEDEGFFDRLKSAFR